MKITIGKCYKDYEVPSFDDAREVKLFNSKEEAVKALDGEELPVLGINEFPSRWEHPYEWIQVEAENEKYTLVSRRKNEHIRRIQGDLVAYKK